MSAAFALAAVVLVSVAVVAPEVGAAGGGARNAAAIADANAIAVALRAATADCGDVLGAHVPAAPRWLFGPGPIPRGPASQKSFGFPASGIAVTNAIRGKGWRGPYLDRVPIDPWGRAYVAFLDPARGTPLAVVSAGPDGVLDSAPGDRVIAGDDQGVVLLP
jgi:hypothetical protein